MKKELLLGEGLREIEILEFMAGGNSYGIDISDIKEILPNDNNITKIPNSHTNIEGIIMPRDFLIPIVNVAKSLGLSEDQDVRKKMIIVSSINDLNIGFLVTEVAGMHRTNTGKITKPGKKLTTTVKEIVTGILNLEDRQFEILEPREIITNINSDVVLG